MKKRYLIIGILSVLILMIGASYAYFTGMIVGEGASITVKAKKLSIVFTDTEKIGGTQIVPGWNVSKTFTVENKSGSVFYYDINIETLVNTFVTEGYLQYKITSTDGGYNMTEYVDIPKSNEAKREKLIENIEIEDGKIHTYKIEFQYKYSENNQSADMGKIFSGSLSITESEIIVVKYKVNGIIQDNIPDKTEPYITSTVTCSNNAEGIWNDEKETVELTKTVKQTICIVEFKEGYTVTLNMDESSGSVVSPKSKVVGRIGKTEFQININEEYDINKGTMSCDNGAQIKIEGITAKITNIKEDTTCIIMPLQTKITFTMDSTSCPDKVNNNSSSCYIIYHDKRMNDWDKTVTYDGKKYSNCTVKEYNMRYSDNGTCNVVFGCLSCMYFGSNNPERWHCWDGNTNSFCGERDDINFGNTACTVKLTCDK